MRNISGKTPLGEGCDKPVQAKDLKVGHNSFSYGTVIRIEPGAVGKLKVRFDSNAVVYYYPEDLVK